MDTALKEMFPFRQVRDVGMATLHNSSLGHTDVGKPALAFRNGFFPRVEPVDKAAAKLLHFGESVRLATVIAYNKNGSLFEVEGVGFEVPAWTGVPAAAFANKSDKVVLNPSAPSATYLQKSGPSAALNVIGSHSSNATTCARLGLCSCAVAHLPPTNIKHATIKASLATVVLILIPPWVAEDTIRSVRVLRICHLG